MGDHSGEQDFRRFYARSFSQHIVTAMLVGVAVLLATGVLDWLFQPDRAPTIWQSRLVLLVPLLLLTLISARGRLGAMQQPVVVLFTLFGVGALLEFGRLSQVPYNHYYNTGLVLMVMFCFVLTRIRFSWALLCSGLLFIMGNLFWVGLARETLDLVVIKNFILLVTCLFSLMATWTVERTFRQHYASQRTLQQERDELVQLQRTQQANTWLQEQLGAYQLRISGDHDVNELLHITMDFLGDMPETGFGAIYYRAGERLRCLASHALPPDKPPAQLDPGEGLAGEAARQQTIMVVNDVPGDYARITSGTGDMLPRQLLLCPLRHQQENKGVIELAMIEPATDTLLALLRQLTERLAQAMVIAEARRGAPSFAA